MKLERCGFCGQYFKGDHLLTIKELKKISQKELDKAPAGYCPNAQGEYEEQNPEPQRYVTRDMAIDAEDPSLEGQPYP